MSDADKTIFSREGDLAGRETPRRNPLLIIGGIGCAVLLCAGILIGGGIYLVQDQFNDLLAETGLSNLEQLSGGSETPSPEPTVTPEVVAETPTPEISPMALTSEPVETATEDGADNGTATSTTEPRIGPITFALGATEDYEPVDPADSFEGEIKEVHAIFEYSGLSPDYVWERVWFHEGNEMLRSEEPWSGAETGVFDYFINAGGEPLSPGEWLLELYIEGELLATASFMIEADDAAEQATADAEQAAATEPVSTETALAGSGAVPRTTPTPAAVPARATSTGSSVSATSTPVPPTPTPEPEKYKLAYTKWSGVTHLLYVGDTNGETEQFIISRAAGPSWTPDGQYIFFFGEEGIDRQEIEGVEYVFDEISNGIVRVNVAPVPTSIGDVILFQEKSWKGGTIRWANVSPNGEMVAYDARPGGSYRIYFLGTEENEQFRFEIIGEQADWSPDSQKLVYRSGRDGITGIWISNRNDSDHTLITNNNDSFPDWSPDGQTIAFARDVDGNVDIYTMSIDGSNIKRLTELAGPDTLPVYTPDGQIIFRSARSGAWGIWKMNGDGTNPQEIIPNAGVGPDWTYSRMSVLGR